MSLSLNQRVFAKNIGHLLTFIYDNNYSCTFGEAYRTPEQAEIYAKEGKGIAHSLHCERLALDINLFSPSGEYLTDQKDYEPFGKYWEGLEPKNRWGGRFEHLVDSNHFEYNAVEGD